jgi:hypothetical protein
MMIAVMIFVVLMVFRVRVCAEGKRVFSKKGGNVARAKSHTPRKGVTLVTFGVIFRRWTALKLNDFLNSAYRCTSALVQFWCGSLVSSSLRRRTMAMTRTRFTGTLTAVAFTLASAAPAFAEQNWGRQDWRRASNQGYEVTCRSRDYSENQCQIDRADRVELLQQISSSTCNEGETWRYDAQTIYVRQGCGARFLVTPQNYNEGDSRDEDYRDGEVRGKKSDNTGTIVAAAVIGGILLYALTSGGKNKRERRERNERNLPRN